MWLTNDDIYQAKENGINWLNLYNRVHNLGWPIEEATTKPIQKQESLYRQYKETCQEHGIRRDTFNQRVKKGMKPEEAATKPVIHSNRSSRKRCLNANVQSCT